MKQSSFSEVDFLVSCYSFPSSHEVKLELVNTQLQKILKRHRIFNIIRLQTYMCLTHILFIVCEPNQCVAWNIRLSSAYLWAYSTPYALQTIKQRKTVYLSNQRSCIKVITFCFCFFLGVDIRSWCWLVGAPPTITFLVRGRMVQWCKWRRTKMWAFLA